MARPHGNTKTLERRLIALEAEEPGIWIAQGDALRCLACARTVHNHPSLLLTHKKSRTHVVALGAILRQRARQQRLYDVADVADDAGNDAAGDGDAAEDDDAGEVALMSDPRAGARRDRDDDDARPSRNADVRGGRGLARPTRDTDVRSGRHLDDDDDGDRVPLPPTPRSAAAIARPAVAASASAGQSPRITHDDSADPPDDIAVTLADLCDNVKWFRSEVLRLMKQQSDAAAQIAVLLEGEVKAVQEVAKLLKTLPPAVLPSQIAVSPAVLPPQIAVSSAPAPPVPALPAALAATPERADAVTPCVLAQWQVDSLLKLLQDSPVPTRTPPMTPRPALPLPVVDATTPPAAAYPVTPPHVVSSSVPAAGSQTPPAAQPSAAASPSVTKRTRFLPAGEVEV